MEQQSVEREVDLMEQLQIVWRCRRLVICVAAIFFVIGCLVAFLLPKEYRAECEVVPQTASSNSSSRISSLAALAGINLSQMNEESPLSPYIYENIFMSAAFRKELLQTKVYSIKEGGVVTLFDYLLSDGGLQHKQGALPQNYTSDIASLSYADYICLRELERRLTLTLDDRKGYLVISAVMPEPLLAAEVVQASLEQLQCYITRLKIEKVQSNLEFVQQRYDEAFRRFEQIQARRANVRDANRNTTRYAAQTYLEQLDAEYSLAMNIYSELAMQLEQAKIKVKEETPVLTIISPVMIPFRKDRPRRMIIICIFAVVGLCVGGFLALTLPAIAKITGWSSLLKMLPRQMSAPLLSSDTEPYI